MRVRLKMLLVAGACALSLGAPSMAGAEVIPLDTLVTGSGYGSTPPTGSVTLTDLGDKMQIDFSISDGDLASLFFNLVEPFDFADLSYESINTAPGTPAAKLVSNPQAPSNLSFDFGMDLGKGSSPGNVVRSGSFVLALAGTDLSESSFYQPSTNAGGTSVTFGAKIQSLGPNGGGSATIGGTPGGSSTGSTGGTEVPAPASLPLLLTGLAALGFWRRRNRAAPVPALA